MSDEIWQCAQMLMWILGIQTTVLIVFLGALHNKLSSKIDETNERIDKVEENLSDRIDKTNERIDRLSEKVEDVDRRLCRIEGSLATQGHCLFNQSKQDQKAQ